MENVICFVSFFFFITWMTNLRNILHVVYYMCVQSQYLNQFLSVWVASRVRIRCSVFFFSVFEEIPILDLINFCHFFPSHVLSAALRARGTENLQNDIGKDFNGCVYVLFLVHPYPDILFMYERVCGNSRWAFVNNSSLFPNQTVHPHLFLLLRIFSLSLYRCS